MSDPKYTLYVFVNIDLKMTSGKIASQVGHAIRKLTDTIINGYYNETIDVLTYFNYQKYVNSNGRIIVLMANQIDMEILAKENDSVYIIDEGITEIPPNSLTTVAFYPSNVIRFELFKLL